MSSCRGVGVVAVAVVGYSLGMLTGSATVAWVVAAVAATGTYLWSRLGARGTRAACGPGCGRPRSWRRKGSVGCATVVSEDGRVVAGPRGGVTGSGLAGEPEVLVEPGREPVGRQG